MAGRRQTVSDNHHISRKRGIDDRHTRDQWSSSQRPEPDSPEPVYRNRNDYHEGYRAPFKNPQYFPQRAPYNTYNRNRYPPKRQGSDFPQRAYSHSNQRRNETESHYPVSSKPSRERASSHEIRTSKKRTSVEGTTDNQPVLPSPSRSDASPSTRLSPRVQNMAENQPEQRSQDSGNRSQDTSVDKNVRDQVVPPPPTPQATSGTVHPSSPPHVVKAPEKQPEKPAQRSTVEWKRPPPVEIARNQPVPSSAIPAPTSAVNPPPPVQNVQENQPKQSSGDSHHGLKIGPANELKLIQLVSKFSYLYDRRHVHYGIRKLSKKAWVGISDKLDMTVDECRGKWRALCLRHDRRMDALQNGDDITEKDKQFVKYMSFRPHNKKIDVLSKDNSDSHTATPASASVNPTLQSPAGSRNSFGLTPSDFLSDLPPGLNDSIKEGTENRAHIPRSDLSFAYDIAEDLQQFNPQQKRVLKAKIWKIMASCGSSLQNTVNRI